MANDLLYPLGGQITIAGIMRNEWSAYHLQVGLIGNDISIGPNTTPEDIIDPSFDGYSRQLVAGWSAPVIEDGHVVIRPVASTWEREEGAATEVIIYGIYFLNFEGDRVVATCIFDPPFTLDPGQSLTVRSVFRLSSLLP